MRPVVLALPLAGPCRGRNSPARRVPSHGTDLLGSRFAIDLVPVDEEGRSARRRARSFVSSEPPEGFVGWGVPVLAPVAGLVVTARDAEPDEPARRAPLPRVGWALGQAARLRRGTAAVAGNHVVVETGSGVVVAVVHLRRGSVAVRPGERVVVGQVLGACGSSGNALEPHVHLQAMDGPDPATAAGVPFVVAAFLESVTGPAAGSRRGAPALRRDAVPREGAVVRPVRPDRPVVGAG